MLERLHGTSFDWLTWSGGGLTNLGLANRFEIIKSNANLIRKHAVGWIEGEYCICRPKIGEIAVMFIKDERIFWTHITKQEFNYLWRNDEKSLI
jgi:hypothetical protein